MADESDLDKRGEALMAELRKLKHVVKKKAPKWLHDLLDWLWDHLF
jgi:signal recognition particle GTPase